MQRAAVVSAPRERAFTIRLDPEGVPASQIRKNQLFGQAATHGFDEVATGAVHWKYNIWIELCKFVDRVVDVILLRRCQMKS